MSSSVNLEVVSITVFLHFCMGAKICKVISCRSVAMYSKMNLSTLFPVFEQQYSLMWMCVDRTESW